MTRREKWQLHLIHLRIWALAPRRLSPLGRIAIATILLLLLLLYGQARISNSNTRADQKSRNAASSARACVSYGADEVSYDRDVKLYGVLLAAPRKPGDGNYRRFLSDSRTAKEQSRDAKVLLRDQLRCPPYPPPPIVPSAPAQMPATP
jgi:hypothetical protein